MKPDTAVLTALVTRYCQRGGCGRELVQRQADTLNNISDRVEALLSAIPFTVKS